MERYKIEFDLIPWNNPTAEIRFKIYKQGGRQIRLVEFTKEFVELDWCTKGHIGYILEGQMEINFNGRLIIFNPGDGLFIPAGEKHKHMAKILSEKVKIILIEDI